MPNLHNKTAPVTGASHALATAGAHVLVHFGNARAEAESAVMIQDALIGNFALGTVIH